MGYNRHIKVALSFIVLFAVSLFFFREFQQNWTNIQAYALNLNLFFVSMSFVLLLAPSILTTYCWFLTLNSLSGKNKITFSESIATVNTSNLTKYIPGKVWSYALQMFWLEKAGFPKSLILYVNLVNVFVSLITSMMLGIAYLACSPGTFPFMAIVPFLIILIIFDVAFIKYNSIVFNRLIFIFNTLFKRNIQYYDTSKKLLFSLHVIYFISAFCFGMGAYLMCFGIGFDVADRDMYSVMSSMMISDVIGFLTVIAPGGLGVREGVMYFMLKGASSGALSLILPIATRIVSMLVDILLGTLGIVMLRNYSKTR